MVEWTRVGGGYLKALRAKETRAVSGWRKTRKGFVTPLFSLGDHADLPRPRFEDEDRDSAGLEQVVEDPDGQRGLAIGRGTGHRFIDPVGSVHDGEFGVQAQMDKHGCIVESPRPPLGRHHHAGCWPSLQSFWLVYSQSTFHFKGFELSALFTFSHGAQIYDSSSKRQMGLASNWNFRTDIFDRWRNYRRYR